MVTTSTVHTPLTASYVRRIEYRPFLMTVSYLGYYLDYSFYINNNIYLIILLQTLDFAVVRLFGQDPKAISTQC